MIIIISSESAVLSEAETVSKNIKPVKRLLQKYKIPWTPKTDRPDEIVRVDPLDHFNKHSGSQQYLPESMGMRLDSYGSLYGLYLLTASCCKAENQHLKKRTPCHKPCYFFPVILTTVLTILAIIASRREC